MKKVQLFILCLILLFQALPVSAENADNLEALVERVCGDYIYSLLDNGNIEILSCSSEDAALEIPSTIDGYNVVAIGDYAFESCYKAATITIPDGVTVIGEWAFYGCTALESIIIPNSVIEIGKAAFWDCPSLSRIEIPNSVTTIGDNAFRGCSALYSIKIPDSVINIGANPFIQCDRLEKIRVSADHPVLATIDGVLFSKPDKRIVSYPYAFSQSEYIIPQGIEIIGEDAFHCSSLTSVIIPESVTTICKDAFWHSPYLTSVSIPDSVTSIGCNAFEDCYKLHSINLSSNISNIESKTFANCYDLASIDIPESVDSIGDGAFYECTSLETIIIPNNVVNIGANPFQYCGKLKSIIVSPDHPALATIEGVLFSKPDKRLVTYPSAYTSTSYSIPQGTESIGDYAFLVSDLAAVEIPNSIVSIGNSAFYWCENLQSIDIPGSVEIIGDSAFESCYGLSAVSISTGVITIGSYAFNGCKNLSSLYIPDTVTTIGSGAFANCHGISSIAIPDSVISVDANPFQYCKGLTQITVSPDHPILATIDGVLFSKPDKRLITYPCPFSQAEYIIPDGIEIIGERAFGSCENIKYITIPDSTTEIRRNAFYHCTNLSTINIPAGVTEIGVGVLSSCDSLASVTIDSNSIASLYCKKNHLPFIVSEDAGVLNGDGAPSDEWSLAYETYVLGDHHSDLLSLCEQWGEEEDIFYSLYDMDQNGIPELIVCNGGQSYADLENYVFTYDNNRISYIGDVGFRVEVNELFYCDNDEYPGLFFETGVGGVYFVEYAFMDNNTINTVEIKEELDAENSEFYVEQHAGEGEVVYHDDYVEIIHDDALLAVFEGTITQHYLLSFDRNNIQDIGWTGFVKACLG